MESAEEALDVAWRIHEESTKGRIIAYVKHKMRYYGTLYTNIHVDISCRAIRSVTECSLQAFGCGLGCDAGENVVLDSLCSYEKQMVLVSVSVPLAFEAGGCSAGRKAQYVTSEGSWVIFVCSAHTTCGARQPACQVLSLIKVCCNVRICSAAVTVTDCSFQACG